MSADQLDLPLASISRIIKNALPPSIQVSKDVKQSFARAAGIFILYLTHTANDYAHSNKRTTVSAEDVLAALQEMELDPLIDPLLSYLKNLRRHKAIKSGKSTKDEEAEILPNINIVPTKKPSRNTTATIKRKAGVKRKSTSQTDQQANKTKRGSQTSVSARKSCTTTEHNSADAVEEAEAAEVEADADDAMDDEAEAEAEADAEPEPEAEEDDIEDAEDGDTEETMKSNSFSTKSHVADDAAESFAGSVLSVEDDSSKEKSVNEAVVTGNEPTS